MKHLLTTRSLEKSQIQEIFALADDIKQQMSSPFWRGWYNKILDALSGLEKPDYRVHTIDDAWFSAKSITNALGGEATDLPSVRVVRVNLSGGMLELHPHEDVVRISCYCIFGGNFDKGEVPLDGLKDAVIALKDHYCPPWGA